MKYERYKFKKQAQECGVYMIVAGGILTAVAATTKIDIVPKTLCIGTGLLTAGCGAAIVVGTTNEMAKLYSEMDTVEKAMTKVDDFIDRMSEN